MNSESGRESFTDFKNQATNQLKMAAKVEPTVTVTEMNWKAVIGSQKTIIDWPEYISEKQDTLMTKRDLDLKMNGQIASLKTEYSEQLQKATAIVHNLHNTATSLSYHTDWAVNIS